MAPEVAYDTPNPGVAGSLTYDDSFVFNGAMDRFDLKIVGKKEMYHPVQRLQGELYAIPNRERRRSRTTSTRT